MGSTTFIYLLACAAIFTVGFANGLYVDETVNRPGCAGKCNPVQGTDWSGNDIVPPSPIVYDNEDQCCAKCTQTEGCRAWIWNRQNRYCWLKKVAGTPSWVNDIAYGQNFDETVPDVDCGAKYGYNAPGGDIRQVEVGPDPAACCQLCKDEPACDTWTWNRSHNMCWLKTSSPSFIPIIDCISGH